MGNDMASRGNKDFYGTVEWPISEEQLKAEAKWPTGQNEYLAKAEMAKQARAAGRMEGRNLFNQLSLNPFDTRVSKPWMEPEVAMASVRSFGKK